ncbi:hypothetical protein CI109_102137 [Kwoniella shandongensis]|uniref:Uncharacterized protein n=1 Tax=Kwoniella shandongensis TaxID=1734106 RepID=A0A5M6BYW7_9TREE|nr:uncharacterized protein CI109_003703 [Kwoniella shandongensis]KAA5528048.1 hypothetical protein CI109_003703 [Kwoniella shandongensis]
MPVASTSTATATATAPRISPPLPLPIHFALLPSLLPTRNLSPLLYVLINNIPIYLTLDPSHAPHFSLLPLFLALNPCSPLTILSSLQLRPNEYTLTLGGVVPFVDIWVQREVGKRVCEKLGVGRLFFEEDGNDGQPMRSKGRGNGQSTRKGKGKGLLGDMVAEALSWDEGGSIGHNWIPASAQIPSSIYSLSTLLSTPFSTISLIEDGRYITTSIDVDTRARMIREAQFGDPSKIREGDWGDGWEKIIRLSDLAWKRFLLHPSKPPINPSVNRSHSHTHIPKHSHKLATMTETDLIHSLLPTIPTIIQPQSPSLSFPFALTDLERLLTHPTSDTPPRTTLISLLLSFLPTWKSSNALDDEKRLQYEARMGLSLAELLGGILVSSWSATRGAGKVEEVNVKGERTITLKIENVEDSTEDDDEVGPSRNGRSQGGWSQTVERLEYLRGGSPEPQRPAGSRQHSSKRRKSVSPVVGSRPPKERTWSRNHDIGGPDRGNDGTERMDDRDQNEYDDPDEGMEVDSAGRMEDMQSETMRGWYPFVTLGLAIVAGLLMGYIGPLLE